MRVSINEHGKWEYIDEIPEDCNPYYAEAFIRYLNILYEVIDKSFNTCEYSSLLTIFGVRGVEDAGWDTYESSVSIIQSVVDTNQLIEDRKAQENIHLWIYGHILEASEPYEKIMNFLDIVSGGNYLISRFPPIGNRRQSPTQKIKKICQLARELGIPDIKNIFDEVWDRELRNSVFHSDYSLYRDQVRLRTPFRIYSKEEINQKTNRTLAYFDSLSTVQKIFICGYSEPKIISTPSYLGGNGAATVIVREGHGAIGIKDNYSIDELKKGAIKFRIGRFFSNELKMLNEDPLVAFIPKRHDQV